MKSDFFLAAVAISSLSFISSTAFAQSQAVVFETPREFQSQADFDGDGRADWVIVDKQTGKIRLGYQRQEGVFSWVDNRPSGVKGVAGFSVGNLLSNNLPALVFTSPDGNEITVVDVSSPTAPGRPVKVPFAAGLGPNIVVAVDIGGEGNTAVADMVVGSIYNSPDPIQLTLVRNAAGFEPIGDNVNLPGIASKANHVTLEKGKPEAVVMMVAGETGDTLRLDTVASGADAVLTSVTGLPAGSDYAVGNFGSSPLPEFLLFKTNTSGVQARTLEKSSEGKYQLGSGTSFDLGGPIQRVVTLKQGDSLKLFVIFGDGQKAGVYDFDGKAAPNLIYTVNSTNEITCAAGLPKGMVVFSQAAGGKFSNKYQAYTFADNTYTATIFGSLPPLTDNDNITIPDIRARIAANNPVIGPGDMKPYTNTIPGTRVEFVMVPIPGGEFTMGSPESEASRKPDEGPQVKVKISSFWMGKCEVTWNEYELFMYPDEEKRTRGAVPTDAAGDKLADAVTHPSKPYVEMSFGMGKDGYPAISMTQHAANKYCQWLSAKTGQFYRLPTEAEWEYAARAGTTTSRFFGDDESKLPEYAWYEQNSDFKYQKVGKKKANPWGLYDIYGNVVEWVLDQYDSEWYKQLAAKGEVVDPWNRATKPYPHAVRGGSWDDEATRCRSAARRGSDRSWKMQDPQLPKSIWYFSDAQWVGFRIVRPLKVPPSEEMQKCWTSGVERD
jgi:formylglycine-generating enzyme required for sulfatase activity